MKKISVVLILSIVILLVSCNTTNEKINDLTATYFALAGGLCMGQAVKENSYDISSYFYPCIREALEEKGYKFIEGKRIDL